jgi:hypothetical protein
MCVTQSKPYGNTNLRAFVKDKFIQFLSCFIQFNEYELYDIVIGQPSNLAKRIVFLTFFVSIFSLSSLYGQYNFSGHWKGIITKVEQGIVTKFQFELYLVQRGTKVVGRSYVRSGSMYAEMGIEGDIYNKEYLRFQETKIVESKIEPSLEWCIKKGHLIIKNNTISGVWEGNTTFSTCAPGRIELTKVPPQV